MAARLSDIVRGGHGKGSQKKTSEPAEADKARAEAEPEQEPREVSRAEKPPTSPESPHTWKEPSRARAGRCAYLGSRRARREALAYPSRRNACWAKGEQGRRLLRTVRYPFTEVDLDYQRRFCLSGYPRCANYKSAEEEKK